MKTTSKYFYFLLLSLVLSSALHSAEIPNAVADDDYADVDIQQAALGQLLFWDPVLSGNRNISCGTCHHPDLGTSDGVSLSIGEGGIGLGPFRKVDPANLPEQRIPRNAPALFNLGAKEFTVMFHDGRLEADANRKSGIRTPLDDDMTTGFASVLSAQSMFPVLSPDEMAGHYSENDVAKAVRQGLITGQGGAWDIISRRVSSIDRYQSMFEAIDPEIAVGKPIHFTDISDAIAAFVAFEWQADESAFDHYLRGQIQLEERAKLGLELFYGKANCASCHSGPFQTDHRFHAMGVPQIGPGKAARFENHSQDLGRMRVTGDAKDAYAFRTPSLRNIAETGPYGHSGAYRDLNNFVVQHLNPADALKNYHRESALFQQFQPSKNDWAALEDKKEILAIREAVERIEINLTEQELGSLIAFLETLTDEKSPLVRLGIPEEVPSGLPVDR